jgi:chromosome segregation ATPase
MSMYGQTRPSSPTSGQSSSLSGKHLETWENLSREFEEILSLHEQTLTTLSDKLEISETSLLSLTSLYDQLLMQNDSLRNYNQQIGQRMQERDEDLAQAYEKIDWLEKVLLRVIIACAVCGFLFILSVVLRFVGRI